MQRVLAGLPLGIPGIGLEIEGAIQQAPQSARQSICDPIGADYVAETIAERRIKLYSFTMLTNSARVYFSMEWKA